MLHEMHYRYRYWVQVRDTGFFKKLSYGNGTHEINIEKLEYELNIYITEYRKNLFMYQKVGKVSIS